MVFRAGVRRTAPTGTRRTCWRCRPTSTSARSTPRCSRRGAARRFPAAFPRRRRRVRPMAVRIRAVESADDRRADRFARVPGRDGLDGDRVGGRLGTGRASTSRTAPFSGPCTLRVHRARRAGCSSSSTTLRWTPRPGGCSSRISSWRTGPPAPGATRCCRIGRRRSSSGRSVSSATRTRTPRKGWQAGAGRSTHGPRSCRATTTPTAALNTEGSTAIGHGVADGRRNRCAAQSNGSRVRDSCRRPAPVGARPGAAALDRQGRCPGGR